jgi:hypothetical protein
MGKNSFPRLRGGSAVNRGVTWGSPSLNKKANRPIVIRNNRPSESRTNVQSIMSNNKEIAWNSTHGTIKVKRIRSNRQKLKVCLLQTVGPYKAGSQKWVNPKDIVYVT